MRIFLFHQVFSNGSDILPLHTPRFQPDYQPEFHESGPEAIVPEMFATSDTGWLRVQSGPINSVSVNHLFSVYVADEAFIWVSPNIPLTRCRIDTCSCHECSCISERTGIW